MRQLEAIVHPMLGASRKSFLDQAELSGAPVAVIDVPAVTGMRYANLAEHRVSAS